MSSKSDTQVNVYFKYDDFFVSVIVWIFDETENWHEKCFDYFDIEMVDIK